MLTPTDSLHGGVGRLHRGLRRGDTVYVLGGSAAVADSVLEDMEALANEPTVTRIEGADRYATAAAVASKLGGSASWCGGDEVAALLVSGESGELINAVIAGPIAHRLQLPVLMTAADELPSATTDFIESQDVEQIVIVGGTDSVSEGVEAALTDSGVANVLRIAGDTPAATSVALAELMTGDCSDDLAPVSEDTVALVHRDALPDGVTAAPVLSSTYANSGDLVAILVVGDTLPASVRDYLATTSSEYDNGDKIDLSIVAIGGTAAVSDSVMDAALTAAQSDDQLTVQISGSSVSPDAPLLAHNPEAVAGSDPGQTFWLHFSDDIEVKDVETKIRDILEINGVPARLGQLDEDVAGYATPHKPIQHASGEDTQCASDVIQVTLLDNASLNVGDTVAVASSDIDLGASKDKRTVVPASETVRAEADTTRPTVSIQALVGQPGFRVAVMDRPNPAYLNYYPSHFVQNTRDGNGQRMFKFTDSDDDESIIDIVLDASGDNEITSITNTTASAVITGAKLEYTVLLGIDADSVQMLLEPRDRITVKNAVFEDAAGNRNRSVSASAVLPPEDPKVTSVRMSNVVHSSHMEIKMSTAVAGDNGKIWIAAKPDGGAAGAAGNDWAFVVDKTSTWDKDQEIDIDVRVNSRDKVVSVRINDGTVYYDDFVAALNDHNGFSSMFEAFNDTIEVTTNEPCGKKVNEKLPLNDLKRQIEHQVDRDVADDDDGIFVPGYVYRPSGSHAARTDGEITGVSRLGIETTFNGYVDTITEGALFFDVFAATLDRTKVEIDSNDDGVLEEAELTTARSAYDDVAGTTLMSSGDGADGTATTPVVATPTKQLRYELWLTDAAQMPQARDVVAVAGGKDAVIDDPDTADVNETAPEVPDIAAGFTDDPDTVPENETLNASSQARIFVSSAVGAPVPEWLAPTP